MDLFVTISWSGNTILTAKICLVSSHDVSTRQIKLCWTWYAPPLIAVNADITPPMIDEDGTVYMSSMPLVFAIDNRGKPVWTSRLATSNEMRKFQLISFCITMNSKRRIIYILSGSTCNQKSNWILYFITAVHMDTGRTLTISFSTNRIFIVNSMICVLRKITWVIESKALMIYFIYCGRLYECGLHFVFLVER
jgi:hypothetical protein